VDVSFPLTLPSPPRLGERVGVRGLMRVETNMGPFISDLHNSTEGKKYDPHGIDIIFSLQHSVYRGIAHFAGRNSRRTGAKSCGGIEPKLWSAAKLRHAYGAIA
jgi:hypothetical protein